MIPDDVKAIYKTVWEIGQKKVLELAADRGAFICQSQSLNVHMAAPTNGQLTNHTTRMGRYGLTIFYCTNYISAIHPDYDVGAKDIKEQLPLEECRGACYPCVQLEQTGTNKKHHEWDFIMSDFGMVIETHSNTVWYLGLLFWFSCSV